MCEDIQSEVIWGIWLNRRYRFHCIKKSNKCEGYVILKMSKRAEVVCDKSKNIRVKKWNLRSDIVKRYPFSKFTKNKSKIEDE